MKRTTALGAVLAASLSFGAATAAFAQTQSTASQAQQQTLTIYSSRFAVVQEVRQAELKTGENAVQLGGVSGQYRPQTLMVVSVEGAGQFTLRAVSYQQANLNSTQLLANSIGKTITVSYGQGVVTGKLIAVSDGELIVLPDDQPNSPRIIRNRDQVSVPELPQSLSSTPSLTLQADAAKAGQYAIRILYQSSGFSWTATHSAVYDEKAGKLTTFDSSVAISNDSGTAYKGVDVNLLSGNVQDGSGFRLAAAMAPGAGAPLAADAAPASVQSLGEQKLYTLPGKVDINVGENKQIPLLSAHDIPVDREYYFTPEGDSDGNKQSVNMRLHVTNDSKHNLGKPLPAGSVRLYQADAKGNLQLTGTARVNDVAVGEKFNLELGTSTDLKFSTKVLSDTQDPRPKDPQATQPLFETQVVEVTVFNSKDKDVTVNLRQYVQVGGSLTQTSQPFVQENATSMYAPVVVPHNGQMVVRYTLSTRIN
ncbi:MAG TPA: hypothetical protein V6C81_19415 [Planktothrix sp.]|jgi:hypothetical protein